MNDGRRFAERLLSPLDFQDNESQIVHVATDGETYGHHHKHGEMALAFCLDYIEKDDRIKLTNYAQFLSLNPPVDEARIIENSSWSCVHGVERWRANCGCNSGKPGWHQNWRKPLRDSLDWLRERVAVIFELEASKVVKDPWKARNEYINVVLKRNDDNVKRFLKDHALSDAHPNQVLRIMEMQRHAMLMYTSCGWFFDEISGIETIQVMQYACRVIQLANQICNDDLEPEFIQRLSDAPSNVSTYETGDQSL